MVDVPIKCPVTNDFQIDELKRLLHETGGKEQARVDDILAKLELAKRTIIELEKEKLDLTQKERGLKELFEEEELRLKTLVSFGAMYRYC